MKNLILKEKTILEILSDIYIFVLILIFPFMVDKTGFFRIFECKWYSYLIIASTYLVVSTIVFLYFLIFKKINYFKHIKITIIHYLALAFLVINIISCFLSPYFDNYNLFIGIGRGEGLIMMSLYILSFIYVSLFAKFKKQYILYFSISSIILSSIAMLQYIGFNPFNMYQNGLGTHNVSFMATIGNIDFLSAVYCIFITVSFCAFLFLDDNKKYESIIHLLSIFMGTIIISIIDVLSGKVAFLGVMVIIFPFIIINNNRLSRFLIVLSIILLSYCTNIIINPEYHYDIGNLGLYFQFNYITTLLIVVSLLLFFVSKKLKSSEYSFDNNKKFIKCCYFIIASFIILALAFIYLYKFESGFLYEIHEIMHLNFDDSFGTYRIFLWKRTLTLIDEYPIIGSGPDTFAVRFMSKFTNDVAAIGPLTINDTAANVYLTMIINIGILGLFCYLCFISFQIKKGIKHMNNYSKIFLVTILCYLIQDFFNLSLVITTPIFYLLMALHYISISYEKTK